MRENKRNLFLVILASSIFLADVLVLIIFTITGVFDTRKVLEAVLIGALVILGGLLATTLLLYFNQHALIRTLQIENSYVLGKKIDFNNIYFFQKRVLALSRFRKKQKRHIIAFTISNLVVSQNINRNMEIFALNGYMTTFLSELYKKVEGAKQNDFIFAYSRGTFLIYTFKQNEVSIKKIVEIISAEIYDFAAKECPHIWVQPFFGVSNVNKEETVAQQIENAVIARDYSERNFESLTFYQPNFRRGVTSSDVEELERGLKNNEFIVYYQPKYNLDQKKFVSTEALIRWNSSKYGLLTPTKFLGKAETAGLIHEIDTFVLKKVCEDLNDFRRRGKRLLPVSVNFSLYEFYSANFLDTIVSILEEYKIPTSLIEIEITEATSQANSFLSISIIKKLKERGIRVLMDDFGVGFSNVGNLRKIPFDAIKIDKSFIDDIVEDVKSREIVRFLINLCKVNGMEVIAEGVDNKDQLDILKKNRCDTIQGFYYSEPLAKLDYEKFLMNNPFEKKEGNAL